MKHDVVRGLKVNHGNGEAAPLIGFEGKGNGLHAAHGSDGGSRFVHAHHEGRTCIGHDAVRGVVGRSQSTENGRSGSGDFNAHFGVGGSQNVNGGAHVAQSVGQRSKFAAVEMEEAAAAVGVAAIGDEG